MKSSVRVFDESLLHEFADCNVMPVHFDLICLLQDCITCAPLAFVPDNHTGGTLFDSSIKLTDNLQV